MAAPSYAPSGSKFGGPKSPGAGYRGIGGGWWAPPGSAPAAPATPTPPAGAPAGAKHTGPTSPGAGYKGIGGGWWAKSGAGKGKGGGGGGKGKGGGGGGMPITAWNNPKNPLYDPTKGLSGKTLLQAAQALANAQTNPAIHGLQDQINLENRTAANQQKTDAGYFNALGKFGQQGAQQINQNNQWLQGALGQVGSDTQHALGQVGQNAQQTLQQYSPGGDNAAGMSALTQELARQQGLAAQDAGTFRAGGLVQGANYSNLANANLGAYAAAGREDIGHIASANLVRQEPLTSKIAQLRENRANLIATDAGKLRQQEITNQFTAKGLNIKDMANKITAANDAAKNQLTLRGQNITAGNDQATQSLHWAQLGEKQQNDLANQAINSSRAASAANRGARGGGSSRLTLRENNTMQALLDSAINAVPNLQKSGSSEQAIRSALVAGGVKTPQGNRLPHMPQIIVEAAYELLGWGYVQPKTAAALHNMGMYSNTFRNSPIRVSSPPASNAGVDAVGGAAGITALGLGL